MSRHIPSMSLVAVALIVVMGRTADPVPARASPGKPAAVKGIDADLVRLQSEAATRQQALRRQFDEFQQSLLRLAQRLEASKKPQDRDMAAIARRTLALAGEQGLGTKFTNLAMVLKTKDAFTNLQRISDVREQNETLRKDLRKVFALLLAADVDRKARSMKNDPTPPGRTTRKEKATAGTRSEKDWRAEFAKRQELVHLKFDEVLTTLLSVEARLGQVMSGLAVPTPAVERFARMSARCEDILHGLEMTRAITREALADYQQLLEQMKNHTVDQKTIDRLAGTAGRTLMETQRKAFQTSQDAVVRFRKALDETEVGDKARVAGARTAGAEAKNELRKLIGVVRGAVAGMEFLPDLPKLIAKAREIEDEQGKQCDLIEQIRKRIQKKLEEQLLMDAERKGL